MPKLLFKADHILGIFASGMSEGEVYRELEEHFNSLPAEERAAIENMIKRLHLEVGVWSEKRKKGRGGPRPYFGEQGAMMAFYALALFVAQRSRASGRGNGLDSNA